MKILGTLQHNLLGHCYYRQHKYSLAIKYLKESEKYDARTAMTDERFYRYRDVIASYIQLGAKDSALRYVEIWLQNTQKCNLYIKS
jgi:hypothetical protein